jgi:ribosomal protein L7Ae-like RNA K-turn-binding protein
MENKLLHLLGIARRAGRLASGSEAVREAIRRHRAVLVLLASDLSPRTVSGITRSAEQAGVKIQCMRVTMEQMGLAIGKNAGVIAVNDRGFANKLLALNAEDGGGISYYDDKI